MIRTSAKEIGLILVALLAMGVLAQTEEVDTQTEATTISEDEDNDFISLEEMITTFESIAKQCYPEPERVHIEEFLLNEENAHMTTKCFRFCLMVLYELIDSTTNKVNDDSLLELLGYTFTEDKDKLRAIANTCSTETQSIIDHCEYAHKHNMCMLRELTANGIDVPEVKRTSKE